MTDFLSTVHLAIVNTVEPLANEGVPNGTLKNVGLGKFWQDLEISEAFLISLEVSFFHGFVFTFLSLKILKTESTSLIAKSTSCGLSDTSFFARCMSSVVHRDQSMRQVVTYKRVKAMENFKTVVQESGHTVPLYSGLFTRGCNCSDLTEQILVC